jgi:hypothetical protein
MCEISEADTRTERVYVPGDRVEKRTKYVPEKQKRKRKHQIFRIFFKKEKDFPSLSHFLTISSSLLADSQTPCLVASPSGCCDSRRMASGVSTSPWKNFFFTISDTSCSKRSGFEVLIGPGV